MALGREPGDCLDRPLGDALGVCGAPREGGVVARRRKQRVDRARELERVSVHVLERRAVVVGPTLAPQRDLGLGDHAGERGAQLVRELD